MKKILTLIVLLICVQAQAFNKGSFTKTLPFIRTAIVSTTETAFWEAAVATGTLITVLEKLSEPLENFDAGIFSYRLSETTKIAYPEWNYPQRDLGKSTFYNYFPDTRIGHWSIRTEFTVTLQDGTSTTTIEYSITPPAVPDFETCNFTLKRTAVPGLHQSNFNYAAVGLTMFYLMRNGASASVRPVVVETTGWLWTASLGVGDLVRKLLSDQYSTKQWVFQTPMSYSIWMPKAPSSGKNVEWSEAVTTTAFWPYF